MGKPHDILTWSAGAIAEAIRDGRIVPGDLVLMEAFGGGFTWGASLARI